MPPTVGVRLFPVPLAPVLPREYVLTMTNTTTAKVSDARYWFDLMDDSEAADKRRQKAERDGGEACTACGRKVNQATCSWVHATNYGHLFDVSTEALRDAADHDADSQGCWAIGSECAKRVPAEYRMKW